MSLIVGASQYLNASILANKKGTSAVTTNLLAGRGTVDMLDVARRVTANNGIGLSASARQINKQFLQNTQGNYNALFGLAIAGSATIEALVTKINAIRSSMPQSQIREDLRGVVIDQENNGITPPTKPAVDSQA